MIILIVALFTVLTFVGFMFIEKKALRYAVGGVSLFLLVLSVLGLTYHLTDYWGMKEVTKTTEKEIYTAGDTSAAYGMVIDQEVGTKSGNYVFIYRDKKDDAKPETHFVPDEKHITDAVKKTAVYKMTSDKTAKVVTETTTRAFSSSLMKTLFGVGGEEGELVKEKTTVYVPEKTWLLLSADQAKELQEKAPQMQEEMQAQMAANPEMAMQMAQMQQTDPEGFAAMQVEQVKKLLGV
jgi:hypothetical protein